MTQSLPNAGNWVQGELTRLEGLRGELVVRREQELAAITQTDDDLDQVERLMQELDHLRGRC